MSSFKYTPLRVEDDEVRLMTLMPGGFDDNISIYIFHALLPSARSQAKPNARRLSIKALQQTVPEGWRVRETLEGRYLFVRAGISGGPNSWDHPDPDVERGLYETPQEERKGTGDLQYEALSYVWGPTNSAVEIQVLGQPASEQPHSTLSIGANLASALRYLRYGDQPRTLWVDAICINQQDIGERSAQVGRMGSIYSRATQVIVWLGPEAGDSTHALQTLVYFGNQIEYTTDGTFGDAPGAHEMEWWKPSYHLPYDARTWASLTSLFRRMWFGRVWVLQEVLSAGNRAIVQCGNHRFEWSIIRKAMLGLREKTFLRDELRSFLVSYKRALDTPLARNLPRLLLWARPRECADPRDKIYGILGLLSPSISRNIIPDYTAVTWHVYRDALLAQVQLTKRTDLLRHAKIEQCCSGWPSWVPDWTAVQSDFFGHPRQASGSSAAEVHYYPPNVLEVSGIECCTISSANDVVPGNATYELQSTSTNDYVAGGSLLHALLEVVSIGRTRDRYPSIAVYKTMEELQADYQHFISGNLGIEDTLRCLKNVLNSNYTTYITTQEGYLGVTSASTQKGGCLNPLGKR